jgi:hypothetical protein
VAGQHGKALLKTLLQQLQGAAAASLPPVTAAGCQPLAVPGLCL